MKKIMITFGLFFCVVMSGNAQNTSNVSSYHERTIGSAVNRDFAFNIVQPLDNSDAILRKHNHNGILLNSVELPNYNPSFAITQAYQMTARGNNISVVAETWATTSGTRILRSESLLVIPESLDMSNLNSLVAYQSDFSSVADDGNNLYILYRAINTDAALGVNPDGSLDPGETAVISNAGDGNNNKTRLIITNRDNPQEVSYVIDLAPNATSVNPFISWVDGRPVRADGIVLSNGYIAIKYVADGIVHLSIFDPENPVDDAGNYNPVHEFTGNDQGQMDDLNIAFCNDNYYVSYWQEEKLIAYDQDFNPIHETHEYDFSFGGIPAGIQCLSNGDLKVMITMGSAPLAETPRSSFLDKRLNEKYFVGGFITNWRGYFKSHPVPINDTEFSDTESIVFGNFQGESIVVDGVIIPSTNGNLDYRTIFHRVNQIAPTTTISINDSPAEFISVYMHTTLDPNDPTQLIDCGDCAEVWVTIPSGTVLPENLETALFLQNGVNVDDNHFLHTANMGIDEFKPLGFQDYYLVKTLPNGSSYSSPRTDHNLSLKVYLTKQPLVFLDVDGFDNTEELILYPNPTNSKVFIGSELPIDEVHVYDMTGQAIGHYEGISKIDLSAYTSGVYIFRIYAGGSFAVKKIVKQ
jgi:hypothetical protein